MLLDLVNIFFSFLDELDHFTYIQYIFYNSEVFFFTLATSI